MRNSLREPGRSLELLVLEPEINKPIPLNRIKTLIRTQIEVLFEKAERLSRRNVIIKKRMGEE